MIFAFKKRFCFCSFKRFEKDAHESHGEFKRKRQTFSEIISDDDDRNEEKDDTPLITRDDVSDDDRPMWMIMKRRRERFKSVAQCLGELRDTQDFIRDTMGKRSDKLNSRSEMICANISRRIREANL